MSLKIPAIVGILAGCLLSPVSAFSLEPTGCRFSSHAVDVTNATSVPARALEHLAAMARAKDRGDGDSAIAEGRQASLEIATQMPRTVEIFLDVADRLSPHVISDAAELALAQGLLEHLRPITGQALEIDTGILRAALKAHYRVHLLGTDRLGALAGIRKRIEAADICPERRFFLLLEVARHVGAHYDQPLAVSRLKSLRLDAGRLAGVGRGGRPMKWLALKMLTTAAVDLGAFVLAETWLADTIREVERLEKSGVASPAILDSVTQAMVNLPEYVEGRRPGHPSFKSVDSE